MHMVNAIALAPSGSPLEDSKYINLGFTDLRFDPRRRIG